MTPTPNPTIAELREMKSLIVGDVGGAQNEIVERLRALLPAHIADENAQRGWTNVKAIPPLKTSDIGFAPRDLTDEHAGKVLVGMSVQIVPEGIGGGFRSQTTVRVSCIDERLESAQQEKASWAKAEAVITCLFAFLSGCVNGSGDSVWKSLVPTGYDKLQGDWAQEYSGTVATFTLVQPPAYDFDEDDED